MQGTTGCSKQANEQPDDLSDDNFPIYAVPHKKSLRPVPPFSSQEMDNDDDLNAPDSIPPPVPPQTRLSLLDVFGQSLSTVESTKTNGFSSFQDSASPVYENEPFQVDWSRLSKLDQPNLPPKHLNARDFPSRDFALSFQDHGATLTSSALNSPPEMLHTWPETPALPLPIALSAENPYDKVADDSPENLEPEENPYEKIKDPIPPPLSSMTVRQPASSITRLETAVLQLPNVQEKEHPYDLVADDPSARTSLESNRYHQVLRAPIPPLPYSRRQSLPESLHTWPREVSPPSSSAQGEGHGYHAIADTPSKAVEADGYSHLRFEGQHSQLQPSMENGGVYEQVVHTPTKMAFQCQEPNASLSIETQGRNDWHSFTGRSSGIEPLQMEQKISKPLKISTSTATKGKKLCGSSCSQNENTRSATIAAQETTKTTSSTATKTI